MANQINQNLDGLQMYHLRRIGRPASRDGVISVMDFYRITYMIGRSAVQVDFYIDSDNHIQSASLSRCHARVVRQNGNQHRIYDDSLNGVFVNNIKIAGSCVLREGDKVTFGHPCGARLPAGSRSRQPDSDNQFMFEMCDCERNDKNAAAEKTNKEASGFKKPISPAESNGSKSPRKLKRAARQTTQSFSQNNIRQLKKAWEDRQSDSSASETSDVEDTSNDCNGQTHVETDKDTVRTEAADEQSVDVRLVGIGASNTKLGNDRNDVATDKKKESRSVKGEDSKTSDESKEREQEVGNVVNDMLHPSIENERVKSADDQGSETENELNEGENSLLLDGNKGPKDDKCESTETKDLAALEGTFNSIMKDLCALRGTVENEVENTVNIKQIPVMPGKSPSKDASIQTSQSGATVDVNSRTEDKASPTKDMGIQTSQTMICELMDKEVNESDDEMSPHGSEITATELLGTVPEMESHKSVETDLKSKPDCINKEVHYKTNKETECAKRSDESFSTCIETSEGSIDQTDVAVVENSVETQLDTFLKSDRNPDETFKLCIETAKESRDLDCTSVAEEFMDSEPSSVSEVNELLENQNIGLSDDDTTAVDKAETGKKLFSLEETNVKPEGFSNREEEKDENECLFIRHEENKSVELELDINEKEDTDLSGNFCIDRPSLTLSDSIEYDEDEEYDMPGMELSDSIKFSDNDSDKNTSDSEGYDTNDEKQSDLAAEIEISNKLKEIDTKLPSRIDNSFDECPKSDVNEKAFHEEIEFDVTNGKQNDSENTERDDVETVETCEEIGNERKTNEGIENRQETCLEEINIERKRKYSNEFINDTVTDSPRKRHCSENKNVLNDCKNSGKFVQAKESHIENNSLSCDHGANNYDVSDGHERTEEEASRNVDQSDEEEEEKELSASQKGLQKLKTGVKRFFKFWSKKSFQINDKSASDAGYIYLKDTAGNYRLLELEFPHQISDSSKYPCVDYQSQKDVGEKQSENESNPCIEQDQSEVFSNAFEEEQEESEEKGIGDINCENVHDKLCQEKGEVSALASGKTHKSEAVVANEPEDSNMNGGVTTIVTTDATEEINDKSIDPFEDKIQSICSEANSIERRTCQANNEIDSDDMISMEDKLEESEDEGIDIGIYGNVNDKFHNEEGEISALATEINQNKETMIANEQDNRNVKEGDITKYTSNASEAIKGETKDPFEDKIHSTISEVDRVETSMCQTDIEIDSDDMIISTVLASAFRKLSKLQSCNVTNQTSPVTSPFVQLENNPDINVSRSQSPVIAKQGTTDNSKSAANSIVIKLFDRKAQNEEVSSQLSCTFSDDDGFPSPEIYFDLFDDNWEKVENRESDVDSNQNKSDLFENDASGKEIENDIDEESDIVEEKAYMEKAKGQNTKDKDVDKITVGHKKDQSDIDDNISDPLEDYMNHETEDDSGSENTCNENDGKASMMVDIDFDFCDSESEKETSELSRMTRQHYVDNQETKRVAKRKSDSDIDDSSPKKQKNQVEIQDLSDTSTPLKGMNTSMTPFKTPSFLQRATQGRNQGSPQQSPGRVSSTLLMDDSQALDMDSLTATQASRVTEQLEVKACDSSRPKASRNKAKDLLKKLREKRRIKEEAVDDFPSSSPTQSTSGTSEIIYGRTENREESQALAVLDDVDKHVNSCRTIISKIKTMFDGGTSVRRNPRVEAWRRELTDIEKRFEFPKTVIAVVGDTGSGKSSLMNAILDHRSVLPTSGIRACTAVVVEVVSNTTSTNFEADIEFLQRMEWMEELQVLLKDLTGPDGMVKNRQPDPTSDAFVSYCKVKAVYGKIDRFEVLARLTTVTHWLGKVKVIKSSRPGEFRRQVEKYIETQEPGAGGQYWPIVKHVRLRMPNCDVCSSGAALVDLPGVRDSNAARDRIAKEYLKNCTAVWVVSSIHRAIDDKTAKELLGENFRRQLLMDGQYGSIAFICTKTDVIIPSEIIRPLDLEEKTKVHEDQIDEMESERSGLDLTVSRATTEMRKLKKKKTSAEKEAKELRDNLAELNNLMDPTDLDSSQSEEKEAIEEYEQELKEKEEELKEAEDRLEQLHEEKQEATQKTMELEKKLNVHRKTIAAICARARNEYARSEIRRDFKAGLKEMKRRAGMLNDDDDEDDIYSDDDDSDDAVGSSAETLRVFCCSSTEYQKMKNLLTDDGPPQVFSSLEDTQIPALRHYVHEMTSIRRKQWLERLIHSVGRFVFDLQIYICEGGDMKSRDRMFARSTIDSELQKFDTALAPVLQQLSSDIDGVFDGSIRQKMEEGAANAASEANDTCAKWSAPVNHDQTKDKRSGGLHWMTYRATVRRQGVYTSRSYGPVDFNEDLAEPVYRSMTIVWDRAFSGMIWKILEKLKSEILNKLKIFISELAPQLEQLGIQLLTTIKVGSQLQSSASNKLTEMVAHLKDMVTNKQRDISRIIMPHIQSSLLKEYDTCAAESGPGTYARIRSCMSQGIDLKRFTMFDEATQQLMQHLIDLQTEILQYVRQVCQSLIQDLRTAFEPLWEAPSNTSVIRLAFQHAITEVCASVRQLYDESGLPQAEERALVSMASNTTFGSGTATVSACPGGSNQITAGGSVGNGWQSYENSFQRKQETPCGSLEQCGQIGVRVKTERLSQDSISETVETVSRVQRLHVKQEKQESGYGEQPSLMNFGSQTLQDLQSGKLEISPLEVTLQTTPVSTATAPKPPVIIVSTSSQPGSVGYSHHARIVTPGNSGQSPAGIWPYMSQLNSVKQTVLTAPTSIPQYRHMNTVPGQNVTRPIHVKSPVTGQNISIKDLKVPVSGTYVPSASVSVPNTMPGPNNFLHSANQSIGSRFTQTSNQQTIVSAAVRCPQVTQSTSSQNRPIHTPTVKLVVGKENVSSNYAAGSTGGLSTASQPFVNSSSHGKEKKNLGGRANISLSQKDSDASNNPPPIVIKTEPTESSVYRRAGRVNFLGTIDLTDE